MGCACVSDFLLELLDSASLKTALQQFSATLSHLAAVDWTVSIRMICGTKEMIMLVD